MGEKKKRSRTEERIGKNGKLEDLSKKRASLSRKGEAQLQINK